MSLPAPFRLAGLLVLSLGFGQVPLGAAEAAIDFKSERLTGDWGMARSRLAERGIDFNFTLKLDGWRQLSADAGRGGSVLGNIDLQASIDADEAWKWEGTSLFVHLLGDAGGRPNDRAGTNGGLDNIEVGTPAFRIYSAWIERRFLDERMSVLAGLHDLNSEFYVTETSGLFLNPTYGIGTEMSATGENGPSIFPVTSLAVRIRVAPTSGSYFQAAVFDGVPGDPARPRGTHVNLRNGDGALLVAEGGWRGGQAGHLGAGIWRYTEKRPDALTGGAARSGGFYFLADQSVFKRDAAELAVFARLGFTGGDVEPFRNSWSLGAVWCGLVGSRPDGRLGLAVAQSELSTKFRAANGPLGHRETQVELTWEDRLTPYLTVQPDLQFTHQPGAVPGARAAWSAGVRLTLAF